MLVRAERLTLTRRCSSKAAPAIVRSSHPVVGPTSKTGSVLAAGWEIWIENVGAGPRLARCPHTTRVTGFSSKRLISTRNWAA